MNINKINKTFIRINSKLSACLVCSILVLASLSTSSKAVDESYGLFIKPKSCVIEDKNQHCEAIIEVQWKLKSNRNVCLYIENRSRALACWQNKSLANETFTIDVASNINLQLRDETTNQVIYSTPFSLYLKLAKYRKKRRNPWSFY